MQTSKPTIANDKEKLRVLREYPEKWNLLRLHETGKEKVTMDWGLEKE